MKLITTTLAAALFATSTFAGEVSMSSAAHLPTEAAPMGTSAAQWIVPLIAIGIIALAISNDDPKKPSCVKSAAEGSASLAIPAC